MEINYSVTYIFEDKQWVSKLLGIAGITLISILAMPLLFVGLVGVAILLGYLVELVGNVRLGHPRPLPQWNQFRPRLEKGAPVLLAIIFYNLPLILLNACSLYFYTQLGDGVFGSATTVILSCVALPLNVLYGVVVWSMLAIGIARYSRSNDSQHLFQFVDLFNAVRSNLRLSIRFIIAVLVLEIGFVLVGIIPILGWLVLLSFPLPTFGHLIGQYARLLGLKNL